MIPPPDDVDREAFALTLAMVSDDVQERFWKAINEARVIHKDPNATESQVHHGLSLLIDAYEMVGREVREQGLAWPEEDPG